MCMSQIMVYISSLVFSPIKSSEYNHSRNTIDYTPMKCADKNLQQNIPTKMVV